MIRHKALLYLGLGLAVSVLWVGCGRSEDPPAADASEPVQRPEAGGQVESSRSLSETAQEVVEKATDQAQALIEQTKAMLSEQNYAGAASGLEKLSGMSLTPEQEELVKELKVEVVKLSAVADDRLSELKALVDEKKYQEASAKLAEMADVKLTPQQQELLDKLKAEIQKGLSGQAVESGKKALGGLLQNN
jgi:hypothetical protein